MKAYTALDYELCLRRGLPPKEREFIVINKMAGKTEWKKRIVDKVKSAGVYARFVTHRVDGPALIYADGYQEWRVDGLLHRLDGPAVVDYIDLGHEWRIRGHQVSSYEEFQLLTCCSDEDIVIFVLKYGEMGKRP